MSMIARTTRAALIGVSLAAGAAPSPAQENPSPALVEALRSWLDASSEYPGQADPPTIRLVPPGHPALTPGTAGLGEGRLRGVYDDRDATIYLVEPWSAESVFDRSVLLHELVHYRQSTAKHWYCVQEQEWRAYKLQAQWLAENDIADRFHWPAILLQSSCAKRDFHPD